MLMDLPWSIQGCLSLERQSPMFFQVNVNMYFTQEVLGRMGWSFVIRHDPRGRPIKYNIVEEVEDGVE